MKDKKTVLFLIPTLTAGGAERVIITLLKNIDRTRFALKIAVVDTREEVFVDEIPEDVEFIDLEARRVRYAVGKIIYLIWKVRPDVVFSTLGHLNLLLGMALPLLPRHIRYIVRETNVVSSGLMKYRYRKLWEALYVLYYRKHDLVICQSLDMRDDLMTNYKIPKEKTIIINNPVDTDTIRELAGRSSVDPGGRIGGIRLVAAGRLVDQKGFDILIRAIALLRNPDIHLVILGEGPLKDELLELSRSCGVEAQVSFAGYQKNPYAWFANADAFVLSSRYEGFPNVVLEALACGTPVIATPAPGGINEILDAVPECVVAKGVNEQELAESISMWLKGPRRRVPETALKNYAVGTIVGRYEDVLIAPKTQR